jgi:hypothetical protein
MLPSSRRFFLSHYLATGVHATMLADVSCVHFFILITKMVTFFPLRCFVRLSASPLAYVCLVISIVIKFYDTAYILTSIWQLLTWFSSVSLYLPITMAARSKAWTVFARSNTGVVGWNPIRSMDVCVRLFCIYVGSGLATGWSPVQGILPTVYNVRKLKKAAKVKRAVGPWRETKRIFILYSWFFLIVQTWIILFFDRAHLILEAYLSDIYASEDWP